MRVCFYATLEPIVGQRRVEVELPEPATVRDLVEELSARWPALGEALLDDDGQLSRRVNIFVDGRNARWLQGLETSLEPENSIDIFPPVAGG
ncbi:MAG: MoaD/ThiS family protein [Myxococcota bacterium]|nr:MoaD/ThiS family protein [Myxococcota bacterium]